MNVRVNYYLILLALTTAATLQGKCDNKVKNEIEKAAQANPYQLYSEIKKKSKGLRDIGFDEKNRYLFNFAWNDFVDYLECAHSFIKMRGNYTTSLYKKYIEALDSIKGKIAIIVERSDEVTEPSKKKMIADVQRLSKETDRIFIDGLRMLHEQDKTMPATWQQATIALKAKDIFPEYELFFKNYEATKKHAEKYKRPLDSEQILDFLRNQRFIGQQKNATVELKNFSQFAEVLEKLLYRLEEDKKKAWFGTSDMQKRIDYGKEILSVIFKKFPTITTSQMYHKVSLSKNASTLIVIAEASSLSDILQNLISYVSSIQLF